MEGEREAILGWLSFSRFTGRSGVNVFGFLFLVLMCDMRFVTTPLRNRTGVLESGITKTINREDGV